MRYLTLLIALMICSLAVQAQDTTVYTRVSPPFEPRRYKVGFYYVTNGALVKQRHMYIHIRSKKRVLYALVDSSYVFAIEAKGFELLEDGNIKLDDRLQQVAYTADNYRNEYTPKPDRKIASPSAKFPPYSQQYLDMTNEQKVAYLDSLAANNIRVNH